MSSVAPGELYLTVDPKGNGGADGALRLGQIVQGRVVDTRANNATTVDVLGQQIDVTLPAPLEVGAAVALRIVDMREGHVQVQLVNRAPAATSTQKYTTVSNSTASDVVRNVRRLVDAAASRIFGNVDTSSTAAAKVRVLAGETILRVAVRGERPLGKLLSFEPETLAASSALAGASSEELLAAQAALERLAIPLTPLTIAAALPEANDPARLVSVLQRLGTLLTDLTPECRISTLLTLAEFLSQIRPHENSVDAQISSYVDQIATGGERKLFELLAALAQRGQSNAAQRLVLTARATERATSLTADIKTQLLAVSNGEKAGSALSALLTEALEVVTAAQLTSLNAAQNMPGAVAFVLPITIKSGGTRAAQITVQRDNPEGRNRPLDVENFRISFVLETRRLGTIRIDVESVARALRVTVEAQTSRVVEELRAGLEGLRGALEARGYRSVAMSAHVERSVAYRDDSEDEEQRIYMSTSKAQTGALDAPDSSHLDTRA